MSSLISSASGIIPCDPSERVDDTTLFTIRRAAPADIMQIPELFTEVYGKSYYPGVYSSKYLTERMASGELASMVAVALSGRVVGHCALAKNSCHAGIGSAAMSVVSRAFRNTGCQGMMLEAVIHQARKDGLLGLTSHSVTLHVFAQKAGQKLGFKRMGLRVGKISEHRTYDGSHPAPGRRMSVAIGYLPLRHGTRITLYPPDHHREFIEMLFKKAGLDRNLMGPGAARDGTLTGRTFMKVRMIDHDDAQIMVQNFGVDILRRIEEMLQYLKMKDVQYISLELPLCLPHTAMTCHEFERLGFYIAGIIPHSTFGDTLVLQYLNNADIDYNDILAASETLAMIKSYVSDHDPCHGKCRMGLPKRKASHVKLGLPCQRHPYS